jgi:hypothetical protein
MRVIEQAAGSRRNIYNRVRYCRPHLGRIMQLYKYVTGTDDKTFWQRVSALLNKGWILHGNPTLAFDTVRQKTVCGQALIKDAPGEFSDAVNISDY